MIMNFVLSEKVIWEVLSFVGPAQTSSSPSSDSPRRSDVERDWS